MKHLVNVPRHGERNCPTRAIKVDLKTDVVVASPVDLKRIDLGNGGEEVLSVGFVGVFDAEVIDDEADGDITGRMAQDSLDVSFTVAMRR